MPTKKTGNKPLTDNQKCVLGHMLKRFTAVNANFAGCALARAGLLKKNAAYTSNLCLPGGSVIRSLERAGLVRRAKTQSVWYSPRYELTDAGRKAAEALAPGNGGGDEH